MSAVQTSHATYIHTYIQMCKPNNLDIATDIVLVLLILLCALNADRHCRVLHTYLRSYVFHWRVQILAVHKSLDLADTYVCTNLHHLKV